MAANPSHLGALNYADESAFGETSTTFDERLPIINNVNDILSALKHDKIATNVTKQYVNDEAQDALGVQDAEFPVSVWLAGHGSSTATGALTANNVETFLGRCFGTINTTGVGGTTTAEGSDADTVEEAGATVATPGALIRVGARGDARGNGEFYGVTSHTGTTIQLLNGMATKVNNDDVICAAVMIHGYETPNATMPSMRFNAQSANQRANIWGAYCVGADLSFEVGQPARADMRMKGSRWAMESASTWPSETTTDTFTPAPCTGGRVFVNVAGTTTRAVRTIRNLKVSLDLQRVPLLGYDSNNAYQSIVGYREIKNQMTVTWEEDCEAACTDTLGGYYTGSSFYHICFTFSAADGSAVGLYLPKAKLVTPRPTQMDGAGLNQKSVTMVGVTGGTVTSALTQSSWRLASA